MSYSLDQIAADREDKKIKPLFRDIPINFVHMEPERAEVRSKRAAVMSNDQPEARDGQAGRPGVAERFVVPRKPGNAGGGKGPQFKTDAIRGEGPGDWATYQLRKPKAEGYRKPPSFRGYAFSADE